MSRAWYKLIPVSEAGVIASVIDNCSGNDCQTSIELNSVYNSNSGYWYTCRGCLILNLYI